MFHINTQKCLNIFEKVYVSSDSYRILEQAELLGAIPIHREDNLCGDTPDIPVFQHALQFMGDIDGIVAVHANNPTIEHNLITAVKHIMELGVNEIMTCHPVEQGEVYKDQHAAIYGSIRGISRHRLENYGDPYSPEPDVLIVDESIEIETEVDFYTALEWQTNGNNRHIGYSDQLQQKRIPR